MKNSATKHMSLKNMKEKAKKDGDDPEKKYTYKADQTQTTNRQINQNLCLNGLGLSSLVDKNTFIVH